MEQTYGNTLSDVKGIPIGRFQVNIYERLEEKIVRLLNECPVLQQEAIALTGAKRSTVYNWYQTGKIPFSALLIIAILAAKRNYFALHELMLPEGMTVKLTNTGGIDGSLRDELTRFMPHLGSLVDTFEQGNLMRAKEEHALAVQELEQMGKEINAKLGI